MCERGNLCGDCDRLPLQTVSSDCIDLYRSLTSCLRSSDVHMYWLGLIPLTPVFMLLANVASVFFRAYLRVAYVNCASTALCGLRK